MSDPNPTTTLSGVDLHSLVLRCYSRECDGDKERMLEMALRDLWRNYPEWPSTFSWCFNDDCPHKLPGRGGGLCAGCVTDCIGEITGNMGDAMRLQSAINQTRHFAAKLRDAVSPQNESGMAAPETRGGQPETETKPE